MTIPTEAAIKLANKLSYETRMLEGNDHWAQAIQDAFDNRNDENSSDVKAKIIRLEKNVLDISETIKKIVEIMKLDHD